MRLGGGATGAVMETGGKRETTERHGRRFFGSGKVAETTVIRQARHEQQRFGGGRTDRKV